MRGGGAKAVTPLGVVTLLYVVALPAALFATTSVGGAMATGSDALLALLVVVGTGTAAARLAGRPGGSDVGGAPSPGAGHGPLPGGHRSYAYGLALLAAFGGWVALTGLWGSHPSYALVKGAGYLALAAGAACIAWSGVGWARIMDAWLVGAGLVLLLTVIGLLSGSDLLMDRVAYRAGAVRGLPLPRLRGPFLHPNGFGDYLLVSGVVLWARWPSCTGDEAPWWQRLGALALAGALGLGLLLTVSSAWVAAGVVLLGWGRRIGARIRSALEPARTRAQSLALRLGGAALAGVTLAGLVSSVRIELLGFTVRSGGIRPRIWASAVEAVLEAPVLGVGAAPVMASAADPLDPSATEYLWDAHNAYLSVLGQFGVAGAVLLGVGVWLTVRHLRGGRASAGRAGAEGGGEESPPARATDAVLRDRARIALVAILVAMAVHALFIAGEDFRHWWAVLGVVGALASPSGRT